MFLVQLILALVAVIILAAIVRSVLSKATVYEFEKGLLYRRGRFAGLLSPGQYWYLPFLTRIDKVDMRLRTTTVAGQEVFTSDNITLKISLAVVYKITDPVLSSLGVAQPEQAMYTVLQLALRDVVSKAKAEELIEKRDEIGQRLLEVTGQKIAEMGLAVSTVGVKDFMFPGEMKRIFAQVVKAQKEGLAALEKARGESAALRHLANAAKMLENNPALMQLRLIQSLDQNSANSLVWGVPPGVVPLPGAKPQPKEKGEEGESR